MSDAMPSGHKKDHWARKMEDSKQIYKFSYLFLINRTIFVRETSFQQVLLSSSGPKENIFISKFIYP